LPSAKLVAAAAVLVAAVAAAAYLLLAGGGGVQAGTTPTQTAPGSTQATGIVKAASLDECRGDSVVAVVYGDGQEKLAEKIAELLAQQLAGELPPGTVYCVAPAAASGLEEARVLPLILVKATDVGARLEQLLLNTTLAGGFRPVRYDVDAVFAVQVAQQFNLPRPVYGVTADLVIVEPRAEVARLDPASLEKQKPLLELIEAVFAAKIARIEAGDVQGFTRDTRPGLVARSSADLAEGNPALRRIGDGLYEARDIDFARVFMQRGLVEAIEYEKSADELGLAAAAAKHPTIGSGSMHIAVFEDLMCPFCARFYNETFPVLEQLAEEGKLSIHLMDLIVHQQGVVPKLHRLLLCYYLESGDAQGYLEAVKEVYSLLLRDMEKLQRGEIDEAKLTDDYNKLYEDLMKRLGADPNCSEAAKLIAESTRVAQRLGITGTPGFAAWRDGGENVVVTEGFRTAEFFERLIRDLQG